MVLEVTLSQKITFNLELNFLSLSKIYNFNKSIQRTKNRLISGITNHLIRRNHDIAISGRTIRKTNNFYT